MGKRRPPGKLLLLGVTSAAVVYLAALRFSGPSEVDRLLARGVDEPAPSPLRTDAFGRLDRDGNGTLSLREARPDPELESRFRALDRDGDNAISRSEFRALQRTR